MDSDTYIDDAADGRNQARNMQTLVEHFWRRWRNEYLTELREFNKFKKNKMNICPNVGDIVIIYDEKMKRSNWRLGRIDKLIISADGKIRTAEVNVITNGKRNVIEDRLTSFIHSN